MVLYPAIDLKEGKCVRLLRGEMDAATVFSDSPANQAAVFEAAGFEWLHVVDLDGAFQGKPANAQAVKAILAQTRLPMQLGGGIRSMDTLAHWLEVGVMRVILGTIAHKNPLFVKEACRQFPGQIAVSIDARNGRVATDGWANTSETPAIELAKKLEDAGVCTIIYTDIARDGAMQGPNIEETVALAEQLTTPVIASGGMSSVEDIRNYKRHEAQGIAGIILGRALYDGAISPAEALAAAG